MNEDTNEWQEYMGNDVLIKRLSSGNGPIAEMKSIVKANIKVHVLSRDNVVDGEEHDTDVTRTLVGELQNASFQIGEGDAVPGLELALRHSSVGEKLRVRCTHKFGYGAEAMVQPPIPASSDLEFEVEVIEHFDVNDSGPESIRLDIATRKEAGNRWFACGDFMRAGRCFTKGAQASEKNLPTLVTSTPGEPQSALYLTVAQLYLDCLNNLAACHLSLKDPFKAREACIKVLEADPNNLRGLLRAGKASLGLHEYSESRMCFTTLLELQKGFLERLTSSEHVDAGEVKKAEDDILSTQKWLKKLKKAEIDYKNRDKSIGKRISKGLFEGKDAIDVKEKVKTRDPEKQHPLSNPSDSGSGRASVNGAGASNEVTSPRKVTTSEGKAVPNVQSGKDDAIRHVQAPATPTTDSSDSDGSSAASSHPLPAKQGNIHPIIKNMHDFQMYYYTAVFVASFAIGLSIL
mmetsp:Transcript_20844/g.35107  ORF Transcript_20844/g.35107 Transcript_20844/m.35107 type:complete len:461 (+) Transcript_20844:124-1506(+)